MKLDVVFAINSLPKLTGKYTGDRIVAIAN